MKINLALCFHFYPLSHLCLFSFSFLLSPKVTDGGIREGMEIKLACGKSELDSQIVCELRRMTQQSLSVITICLIVIDRILITYVFMVVLTQLILLYLTNFPLCFKTLSSQGRSSSSVPKILYLITGLFFQTVPLYSAIHENISVPIASVNCLYMIGVHQMLFKTN